MSTGPPGRARSRPAVGRLPLHRDDAGAVAGWEALPFGFLVVLVSALVAANAWAVVDAKMAVTAAAREGARAFVEAPTGTAPAALAVAAAQGGLRAHGHDPDPTDPPSVRGRLRRCERVSVRVRHTVPALVLPWVGGFGGGITVAASHEEVVDPLRAGLEGRAGRGDGQALCGG